MTMVQTVCFRGRVVKMSAVLPPLRPATHPLTSPRATHFDGSDTRMTGRNERFSQHTAGDGSVRDADRRLGGAMLLGDDGVGLSVRYSQPPTSNPVQGFVLGPSASPEPRKVWSGNRTRMSRKNPPENAGGVAPQENRPLAQRTASHQPMDSGSGNRAQPRQRRH